MNKGRIIKTVVVTSALVVLISMTVFAESGIKNFKDGGYIYLYGQTARQLKKAHAGSVPKDTDTESSLTMLTTTYDDGSEDVSRDGPSIGETEIEHDWEYADGYSSIHRLIRNGLEYERGSLSY